MNPEFQKFLEHCIAAKNKKQPLIRLKVGSNRNSNNAIRSGSSLSNQINNDLMPVADERYSSMCQNDKAKTQNN